MYLITTFPTDETIQRPILDRLSRLISLFFVTGCVVPAGNFAPVP